MSIRIESEVKNTKQYNEIERDFLKFQKIEDLYPGFFSIHALNRKKNSLHWITSLKYNEIDKFVDELEVNPHLDYYITKNSFTKAGKNVRKKENLFGLNNIVIDIDLHSDDSKNSYTIQTVIHSLINDNHLCDFTRIMYTGRGVQVYIEIEQIPASLSFLYEMVAKHQCDVFRGVIEDIKQVYGLTDDIQVDSASSLSTAGLVRLQGTVNTKNGEKTRIVFSNTKKYTIHDLKEAMEEIPKKQTLKTKKTSQSNFEVNLINSRLTHLLEYHEIIPGNRMVSFFLIYNNLVQIKESRTEAKFIVLNHNKKLDHPIKDTELYSMFSYIDKKGFLKFKQTTFIEYLGGEPVRTKFTIRQEKTEALRLKQEAIKTLLKNEKLTYKEIALITSVSERTIKRYASKFNIQRNSVKN